MKNLFWPILSAAFLLTGCSPTYRVITGADGFTYYAYRCDDFDDCMTGIYDKCSGPYETVSHTSIARIPGATPMQLFYPATFGGTDGQIMFRCKGDDVPDQIADIKHDLEELRESIEKK